MTTPPIPQPKMSMDDFAQKIKAQYPAYEGIDNEELADKVLTKYPVYRQHVDIKPKPQPEIPAWKQNPAVRFFNSVGSALIDTPKAIYHAAADPITPEEEKDFQGHTRIPGELTVERLAARPIVNAAKDYAAGKVGWEGAKSVLPEALGTGVGNAIMPELTRGAAAGIKSLPVRAIAGKALTGASDVVDPEVTGIFSPRLAHAQKFVGKVGRAITPKPAAPPIEAPQLEAPMSPAAQQLQSRIGIERGLQAQEPFPRLSEGLPEVEEGQAAATEHLHKAIPINKTGNAQLDLRPVYPGAPLPEAPAEILQSRQLASGPKSIVPDKRSAALAGIPVKTPPAELPEAFHPRPSVSQPPPVPGTVDAPFLERAVPGKEAAVAMPPITKAQVSGLLDKGLGAKSLSPSIPLRQQLDRVTPAPAPKESSVVKSHSYDPNSREMTITTQNGQTYVHGDVTPDQAEAFAGAESKGKAWNELRNNSTLVAKVQNGKRIAIKPTAPSSATPDDLTPELQKSLEAALKNRPIDTRNRMRLSEPEQAQPAIIGRPGTGKAIPLPRKASAPVTAGSATEIRVPGEDTRYRATYKVRELADVQPSHSGINFNPNENYKLVNDRNYSNAVNQDKVVTNSAAGKFDPSYHITDNPDATNGPVVIDSQGHALGGNGRAMILQRVYRYNPRGAEAYRNLLAQKAPNFGIDAAQVAKMKQPVLVREIADEDLGGANQKQNAITDFNKKGTAEMTPAERAISDSRRISQGTLDTIAGKLEAEGEDATIADALRGESGRQIIEKLIDDGVISPQERAGLSTSEGLTEAGKQRISKLLVGRYFRDPAQIDSTPPSIRGKIERMSAPLAKVDNLAGWDLTKHVQDAIDLLEEARTHKTANLDDLLSQRGLFGNTRYSPEAVSLAKHLQTDSATTLAKSVRNYAMDANDAHGMFASESMTPEKAFKDTFKK